MGVIFGGPSSTSFFGGSGAGGLLAKLTVVMAIIFFSTSLGFSILDSAKKIKASQPSIILEKPVSSPAKHSSSALPSNKGEKKAKEARGGSAPEK